MNSRVFSGGKRTALSFCHGLGWAGWTGCSTVAWGAQQPGWAPLAAAVRGAVH
eukprot:COSAG02_NODE_1098_length_14587_cov_9.462590_13_plen_53_part_00